jgi:integron integrase
VRSLPWDYSRRTEDTYVDWIKRYILFHHKRHPKDMGAPEIEQFLTYLAVDLNVAASTQNQAYSAILFLYRYVLHIDLPETINAIRAKKPQRLPTVLTRDEVHRLFDELTSTHRLIAQLLYGSGLRLMEGLRLRVKDIDFEKHCLVVRDGKGEKDRITLLPDSIVLPLREHLARVKHLYDQDRAAGHGTVQLPYALDVKYPRASQEWGWQYIFPARSLSVDPRTGAYQRHHVTDSTLQKAVRAAGQLAGIEKPIGSHNAASGGGEKQTSTTRSHARSSLSQAVFFVTVFP